EVKLTYNRDGKEYTTTAKLQDKLGTFAVTGSAAIESMGADFSDLSKDQAAKLGISGGVVVNNIHDGGVLANQTNMKSGFIITKVGDTPVKSVDDFKAALAKQGSNFQIEGVYPGSNEIYFYGINDFRK
ncbi:MAG TPA: serine protease, partial [Puia sp.]|nr:serine protease [Puia sp.]